MGGHEMQKAFAMRTFCILVGLSGLASSHAYAEMNVEVRVVSSRNDMVSGGDSLVQLTPDEHSDWTARLNGVDVSGSFNKVASARQLVALLTGLKLGRNLLEIYSGGRRASRLDLLNHPRSGPVFSGPQQQPFICETEANGLGPPRDERCDAPTVIQYYYKSTGSSAAQSVSSEAQPDAGLLPGFKIYDPSQPMAPDVAKTVTSEGRSVNYIVRRELGTINRSVYEIRFLHQPHTPLPTPWTSSALDWNGTLVYSFGPGCDAGYRQGVLGPWGAAAELLVSSGYASASATLTNFSNSCNDRVSAETLSMVKEQFIEQHGMPKHTIGTGGSGGAIQQYLIAQNYPGLLDGIIVSASFPDAPTYVQSWTDCRLLGRVFQASKLQWTEAQKSAVSGFATWRSCANAVLSPARPWIHPTSCPSVLPPSSIYDPVVRPNGVRCDIYSNEVNVFGRDSHTGRARRPLDNVGVQYGLRTFNTGKISPEQFIELNERIGGYDDDGNIIETRTAAPPETIALAYERGLVLTGSGGLAHTPIIDWRSYSDDLADNHDRFRSLATRARLISANGNADNQVMLVLPRPEYLPLVARQSPVHSALASDYEAQYAARNQYLIQQMELWLNNITEDRTANTLALKTARGRPSSLADGCWTTAGERLVDQAASSKQSPCNDLYPSHANPRQTAGAPPADDVLKCALKPLTPSEYTQHLNSDQLARLEAIFPSGVCDYSRPGIGQHVTRSTWQRHMGES